MAWSSEDTSAQDGRGFAVHAVRGTGWSTAKGLVTKGATAVGMVVAARFLGPGDYGTAALVLAAGSLLTPLSPLMMVDVLIARRDAMVSARGLVLRIVGIDALVSALVICIAIPVVTRLYTNFDATAIAGLMLAYMLRPVFDALSVLPLAQLRVKLRYRTLAFVEAGSHIIATATLIGMVIAGAGPYALVVPQTAAGAVRLAGFWAYARAQRRRAQEAAAAGVAPDAPDPAHAQVAAGEPQPLFRPFAVAALAQHAHSLLCYLPIFVLGKLSTEDAAGLFTFAFNLAGQATFLVAHQVGIVLQPIFARLAHDPTRQDSALMRSIAVIGAIAVPAALLQAALAEPILRVLFGEGWVAAANTYAALAVGHAFFFAMPPLMAFLRGQGRFRTLFLWQCAQVVCAGILFVVVASRGSAMVAIANAAVWAVAVPWAALFFVGGPGADRRAVWSALLGPWLSALPIAVAAWLCWLGLSRLGYLGSVASVAVVGPAAMIAAVLAVRYSQPAVYADLRPMVDRLAHAVGRRWRGRE